MKKLTLFFALLVTSNLWATIIYEKNGGKFNDYGWENKGDMFAAFMTDAGATGFETLESYQSSSTPLASPGGICVKLTDASPALKMAKWAWLKAYIEQAHTDQTAAGASALSADGSGAAWRYAVGAFFVEIQHTGWPKSADFTELGKDAAYIPAWGRNYGNPTDPTEEVTLVAPYRAGYLFDGWYASADFSGEKVTTVDQNTTGTLYAKWVSDGIVYELNGGKYNDYGWTSKADICLALEADYNTAAGASKDWVKKEDGVIKYNINGVWKTEAEAKGSAANISGFIHANTWTGDGKFSTLILTTQVDKYGWLKDMITANREAQSIITGLNDAAYRQEVSAFFLCSPTLTASGVTSSSYESTGDYEDYQPYWGQAFPNPEHPTAEVVLNNPVKEGYQFGGWYKEADFSGTPITIVDQNFKGTLYAKWTQSGIVYELNGGVWNKYGWTSKKDMYDAFLADWKAYSGSTRGTKTYEEQLGIGNSNAGIPTTIQESEDLLGFMAQEKWAWLGQFLDALATAQGKATMPTEAIKQMRFGLGNFFGEDNNQATNWVGAVDCSGDIASITAFAPYWGQTFPLPTQPTEEVTLTAPYKEDYIFDGWYAAADFSGTKVTKVNTTSTGTLYAKWSVAPLYYELNGGVWNQYGWTSKKNMYDAFLADWKAYSGSTRGTKTYEEQLGIGNSNAGIPTTIQESEDLLGFMAQEKWAWLGQFLDALATAQGKATMPTEAIKQMRFGLGNFFGEDNNQATNWVGAVDCSGDIASITAFAPYWGQTFPLPTQPTEEVTLTAPYKEDYIFDGWYAAADFSGTKVTKVNTTSTGTLYAKWTEKLVVIDDKAVNSTALAKYNGQTVTAKVTRAFDNKSLKTLTLPFSMDAAQIQDVFGETAIVHEFTSVGEENDMFYLHFDPTTTIEAGKPYILQLPTTDDYDAKDGFTIEGVTISTDLQKITVDDITMQPILDGGGRLTQASEYRLASDNYLYSAGAHPTALLGLRAYFINSTGRPIRARVVYGENEATSIPTVVAPEESVRKVLKDGQIIIIRGEKQYNIQGQVIE